MVPLHLGLHQQIVAHQVLESTILDRAVAEILPEGSVDIPHLKPYWAAYALLAL